MKNRETYLVAKINSAYKYDYRNNPEKYLNDLFSIFSCYFNGQIHLIFKNEVALVYGNKKFYYLNHNNRTIVPCGNHWKNVIAKTSHGSKKAIFTSEKYKQKYEKYV